jgi:cyclopropane-fatty-acyl-phospholipid synthase
MVGRWAKAAFLAGLEDVRGGTLTVKMADGARHVGTLSDLDATLAIHDDRFFLRAIAGADIGIGESFMDGDWSSPDLVALIRLMVRNQAVPDRGSRLAGVARRLLGAVARRRRDNSIGGSRRHIRHHYDLGNDFFRLFLDSELLMYSCGYFKTGRESLEAAQADKVDRICRRLGLSPGDRVLEIGSGWGGFAIRAATRYGCHVTTTTISEAQYRHVREWRASAGAAGDRIDVHLADYRELQGCFDKIVSIEMFEAVGLARYDEYFRAVDRLLAPDGAMLLQTITVSDQYFSTYRGSADWIEKHIFPGGELASVGEIVKSLARSTTMSLYHAENFGTHYARTLHHWRERFHDRLEEVAALGFDDRFVRMWDLYLAYCEAAFLERHAGVMQMMLVKNGSPRARFNEPWISATDDQTPVSCCLT